MSINPLEGRHSPSSRTEPNFGESSDEKPLQRTHRNLNTCSDKSCFGSKRIGSVWICLGGLNRLGAPLELGGFVGAAEFAKGFGFGGQIADKIRTVGAEFFFA